MQILVISHLSNVGVKADLRPQEEKKRKGSHSGKYSPETRSA